MREVKLEHQTPEWRLQMQIGKLEAQAQWLLAESKYLREMEYSVHITQWHAAKQYRNGEIIALKWLLAEARWFAEASEAERVSAILGTQVTLSVQYPWGWKQVRR